MRSSFLPVSAFLLAIFAICYSACQKSQATEQSTNGSAFVLQKEISLMEAKLESLRKQHAENIASYSNEMGVTSKSYALDLIRTQNELLESHTGRLEYHKLQLIQGDTTDQQRNEAQLKELKEDIQRLDNDAVIIAAPLESEPETLNGHVTK